MLGSTMAGADAFADRVVSGTLQRVEAAGSGLWAMAVRVGGPAVDQVVRQALLPIHAQRMSALRVQEVVEAERKARSSIPCEAP